VGPCATPCCIDRVGVDAVLAAVRAALDVPPIDAPVERRPVANPAAV
jgi:hypothetical protein